MLTIQKKSRFKLVAVAVSALMLLTACGGKISTELQVDESFKGVRTMTVSIEQSSDNESAFKVPAAKYDASIKKNLPPQLSYQGLVADSKKMSATFELKFDSREEYLNKVDALLETSSSPTSSITSSDTPLVSGVVANESFTSKELMEWLSKGLVADGVVTSSNSSYVVNSEDEILLKFAGKEYKSKAPLKVAEVVDRGVDQAVVELTFESAGQLSAKVWYLYKTALSSEQEQKLTAFLDQAAPEASVDDVIPSMIPVRTSQELISGMVISFPAAAIEEIDKKVGAALGQKSISLKLAESDESAGPFAPLSELRASLDCARICSVKASKAKFVVNVPAGWATEDVADSSEKSASGKGRTYGSELKMLVQEKVPVSNLTVVTDLASNGSIAQTYRVEVPQEFANKYQFIELLSKASPGGKVSSENSGNNVAFTVKFTGSSVEDLKNKIKKVFPDAQARNTVTSEKFTKRSSLLEVKLPAAPWGAQADNYKVELNLPMFSVFKGGEVNGKRTLTRQGSNYPKSGIMLSGSVSAIPTKALITFGVIGVVIVALAALAIVFRRRLKAWLTKSRGNQAPTASATGWGEAQLGQNPAVWQGSASSATEATLIIPGVQTQAEFSEADLR